MLVMCWVLPRFGLALTAAMLILSACAVSGRSGSGESSRGSMPPKGIATAIASTVTSRSTTVTSSAVIDYPAPMLGVVVDAQRRVVDVDANSAAERADIRRGDVLERVGTAATLPSLAEAKRAPQGAKLGTMLPVTFIRDGHEMTANVQITLDRGRCSGLVCPTVTPVPVAGQLDFL